MVLMITQNGREVGRVTVTRGKVTCATPGFGWAMGAGVHVALAWCFRKQLKWQRVKNPARQLELGL